MRRAVRVALLTEIPAPFRLPLFNALAAEERIELEVIFLAEADPRRGYTAYWGEARFRHRVLPGWSLRRGRHWVLINRGTLAALTRFRPDIVLIGGWNQPAFWQALAYSAVRRVPLVTWVESTARDARLESGALGLARHLAVSRSAAVVVPGTAAAEFARMLGAPPSRIVVAPNAVDLDIFRDHVAEARRDRVRFRREHGIPPDACLVLYAGRLDPEKGIDVLLRAVEGLPVEVALVGTGNREEELRAAAPTNVRFPGWLPRDELVPWYAAADVFVLPSLSEPWGMVLNEAAAAALPLVASDAAGAAFELIEEGVNGFRIPAGDSTALRAALERLAGDADLRAGAGERSAELAAKLTPAAWAAAVADVARSLAGQGSV